MDFKAYVQEMDALLSRVPELQLPYPLSGNEVVPPQNNREVLDEFCQTYNLSPDFAELYSECDGLSMNNIWNGYWIFGFDDIKNRAEATDINTVNEGAGRAVFIFGGDGGGSRFALATDGSNSVFFLPSSGSLHNRVWTPWSDEYPARIIAPNFAAFCQSLKADVQAFINQQPNWKYIDQER